MSATDNTAGIHGQNQPRPPRERIVEALMGLASERAWSDIGIADIAERAGVSLSEFLATFPSKGAVLGSFSRMIDMKVLASHAARGNAMDGEPARERLFDIIMMRLDHMAPYREALRTIYAGVRREPLTIAALNKAAQNSWRFMLVAAGIQTEGAFGALRIQGAALLFARTVETWLQDDDPGQAKTMARLDRELERGGKALAFADDAWRVTAPLRRMACSILDRSHRRRARYGDSPASGARRGAAPDATEPHPAEPGAGTAEAPTA